MAQQFYKIVDKNGYEMPEHWSGRNRTYEEAKKMVDNLNKNGEHRPYTMTGTQQTAVEWLYERFLFAGYAAPSEWKDQAKQMEKEQRIKDYNVGYTDAQCNHINDAENYVNEQEYLNKTYGNKS